MGKAPDTIKRKKKKCSSSPSGLQNRTHRPNTDDSEFIQTAPSLRTLRNPKPFNNTTPPLRRSAGRYPCLGSLSPPENDSFDDASVDGDEDDERTKKKVEFVLRLPPDEHPPEPSPTPSSFNFLAYDSHLLAQGDGFRKLSDTGKVNAVPAGYARLQEEGEKVLKATDFQNATGMALQDGPTTPLPDKKLLRLILDKLQKKDTRGVFAEPVDPEELPSYHEVIENPMDFDTVRNKLDGAGYLNLEQFEADIYLICSNAMQYNAPHTIYFRQARSIQELAKKEFDVLRHGGVHADTQPKIARRGRPPKRAMESALLEQMDPNSSSDNTFVTGSGDESGMSNAYNLRKGPGLHRHRPPDGLKKTSLGPQNSDYFYEFQAPKAMSSKPGKKHFVPDERKRDTYHISSLHASAHDPSGLSIAGGQKRVFTPVGLHVDYSYPRSLARFSANLGSVVWKIASRRMGAGLPLGVGFGLECCEEAKSDLIPQPMLAEKLVSPENSMLVSCDGSSPPYLSAVGSSWVTNIDKSPVVASKSNLEGALPSSEAHGLRPGSLPSCQVNQSAFLPGLNGFGGEYGIQIESQGMLDLIASKGSDSSGSQLNGMFGGGNMKAAASSVGLAKSLGGKNSSQTGADAGINVTSSPGPGILGRPSWRDVCLCSNWSPSSDVPSDLNIGFQASSSRVGSPPQLDLVLQL